jgi:small conductance mechanosensitive channel
MEALRNIAEQFEWQEMLLSLLRILFILVLAWVTRTVVAKLLKRLEKSLLSRRTTEGELLTEAGKRVATVMKLVRQIVSFIFWGVVVLILLGQIGVDIGPILAGAGIVGIALGFGAQNLVRDVIAGMFIILENQVRVGDVAVINGQPGFVESVNYRTVVLRDRSGTVHVFPSGGITTLSNMTHEWSAYIMDIGVAYKEDTDHVVEIMERVGRELREDPSFGELMIEDLEIYGVDKFDTSAVVIKARIKTIPMKQWEVGRQYLRRLKHAFDAEGIEIPFPHQTLYFGEASRPIMLRTVEGEE